MAQLRMSVLLLGAVAAQSLESCMVSVPNLGVTSVPMPDSLDGQPLMCTRYCLSCDADGVADVLGCSDDEVAAKTLKPYYASATEAMWEEHLAYAETKWSAATVEAMKNFACHTTDCNAPTADPCAGSLDTEEPAQQIEEQVEDAEEEVEERATELASCLIDTPSAEPASMSLSRLGLDSAEAKCLRYCVPEGPSAWKVVHSVGDADIVAHLMQMVEVGRATNLLVCDTDDCNAPTADACAVSSTQSACFVGAEDLEELDLHEPRSVPVDPEAKCVRYCHRGKPIYQAVSEADAATYEQMLQTDEGAFIHLLVCSTSNCNAPTTDACGGPATASPEPTAPSPEQDSSECDGALAKAKSRVAELEAELAAAAEAHSQDSSVEMIDLDAQTKFIVKEVGEALSDGRGGHYHAPAVTFDVATVEVLAQRMEEGCRMLHLSLLCVGLFVLVCVSLLAFECGRRSAPAPAGVNGLPLPVVTGTQPPLYPSLHAAALNAKGLPLPVVAGTQPPLYPSLHAAPAVKPGMATYVARR